MTEIAGDFVRLDYGPILARVREEGEAFGQTMKAESTTEERATDEMTAGDWWDLSEGLSGMVPLTKELRSKAIGVAEKNARGLVAAGPVVGIDAAIRADCELLAAWENAGAGFDDRERIVSFVMERRNVVDWPAWASHWVGGGE